MLAFPLLCWRWGVVPAGLLTFLCQHLTPLPSRPTQLGSTPPSLGPCSCCVYSPALSLATSWTGGSRTVWTPPLRAWPLTMPGDQHREGDSK